MRQKLELVLPVILLLLASLACGAPAYDDPPVIDPPVSGPTSTPAAEDTATPPAPTPAAADVATPTAPPASGPQTFTGEGVRNDYASDGAVCPVNQPVTLVVKGDGTAELSTVGADIIDHVNCSTGTLEEGWYMNGLVDVAAATVTFQTCNFGRFTADGSLSFADGTLVGAVSCTNQDGIKFITLLIGQ